MGGQGLAIQRQLNFSRDAEREADRVGFQIMGEGGYDTSGMVAFFRRLQSGQPQLYGDLAPAYLQQPPADHERIADIQARIRESRTSSASTASTFTWCARAPACCRTPSDAGPARHAQAVFKTPAAAAKTASSRPARQYGLAFLALKQGEPGRGAELARQGARDHEAARRRVVDGVERRAMAPTMFAGAGARDQAGARPAGSRCWPRP